MPSRLTLGAVNVQVDDPQALGRFWAEALDGTLETYSGFAYLTPGPGGFAMFFQQRTEPAPGHGSQHLDLTVAWGERESEVARLVELGAEHRWDVLDEHPHVRWSTLADPEGNLFCVAEHPPR